MTVSVVAVLREAVRRLATGPALIVSVAFVILQTVARLVAGGIVRPTSRTVTAGGGVAPPMFTPNPLGVVAYLVVFVVGLYLMLVTIRVFAGQWGIVEREHLTRNVGFGLVNLLGVVVVLGVVSVIATVVLVSLLGIVGLVVALVFLVLLSGVALLAPAFVAAENANALAALARSFDVLRRSPLAVFGLVVGLLVVNLVLRAVGSIVSGIVDVIPVVGPLVTAVFGVLGSVFLWIVIARAYDHTTDAA